MHNQKCNVNNLVLGMAWAAKSPPNIKERVPVAILGVSWTWEMSTSTAAVVTKHRVPMKYLPRSKAINLGK